jgi:hypothetical protein
MCSTGCRLSEKTQRAEFVVKNNKKNPIFTLNIKYFLNFESNTVRRNTVGLPHAVRGQRVWDPCCRSCLSFSRKKIVFVYNSSFFCVGLLCQRVQSTILLSFMHRAILLEATSSQNLWEKSLWRKQGRINHKAE